MPDPTTSPVRTPIGPATVAGLTATGGLGIAGLLITILNGDATPDTWKAVHAAVLILIVTQGGRYLQAALRALGEAIAARGGQPARLLESVEVAGGAVAAADPGLVRGIHDHLDHLERTIERQHADTYAQDSDGADESPKALYAEDNADDNADDDGDPEPPTAPDPDAADPELDHFPKEPVAGQDSGDTEAPKS
jgi:hypothetical protein